MWFVIDGALLSLLWIVMVVVVVVAVVVVISLLQPQSSSFCPRLYPLFHVQVSTYEIIMHGTSLSLPPPQ
jgi:hypothetical protein